MSGARKEQFLFYFPGTKDQLRTTLLQNHRYRHWYHENKKIIQKYKMTTLQKENEKSRSRLTTSFLSGRHILAWEASNNRWPLLFQYPLDQFLTDYSLVIIQSSRKDASKIHGGRGTSRTPRYHARGPRKMRQAPRVTWPKNGHEASIMSNRTVMNEWLSENIFINNLNY